MTPKQHPEPNEVLQGSKAEVQPDKTWAGGVPGEARPQISTKAGAKSNNVPSNRMKMTTPKLLAAALAVAGVALNAPAQIPVVVHTAQEFQNALTTAANNGDNNIIQLTNNLNGGYYTGTFNYNNTANHNLTIEPGNGLTRANITLDGGGGGRDLNITSSGSAGDVTVSDITFIRNTGNYQTGALRVAGSSGGNTTVSACDFLSPVADEGMGVEIASGLNTTIFGCSIIGKTNSTTSIYDGNGISIAGVTGTTVLSNNTIIGNYGGYGASITASAVLLVNGNLFQTNATGGLYFYPSGESDLAQVSIVTNVFDYNKGNGGAYLANFATVWLATNLFSGNPGGGAYIVSGVTVTNLKNTYVGNTGGGLELANLTTAVSAGNMFSGNSSSYGGAYFYNITTNIVTGNTFSGNNSSGAAGGAECYADKYLTLSNNTFTGNHANNGSGGGAYIYNSGNAFATVIGNTFTGNSCGGNYGGGALYVQSVSNTITQNTFSLNSSADGGGAIYDTAPVIIITENLLVNNSQSAASATGGAIFVNASATLDMVNNTIFGNSSAGGGGGVSFQVSGLVEVLSVFNNIIWGNSITGGSGGDVYITGSGAQKLFIYNDANDMSGVWDLSVPGINLDPAFFDPINGDYHFPGTPPYGTPPWSAASPCANAGTTTAAATPPFLPAAALTLVTAPSATDLDGNPRINTGGFVDLGCYEFNYTAFHPADIASAKTITQGEYNSYSSDWLQGEPWSYPTTTWSYPTPNPNPIPADYVTRAGYLLEVGGGTTGPYYNDGSARPINWKPGTGP